MSTETRPHPPVWLITLMALPVLFALAMLFVAMSFFGARPGVTDVLLYSAPLLITLGAGSLIWWAWMAGRRAVAIGTLAVSQIFLLLGAAALFGLAI